MAEDQISLYNLVFTHNWEDPESDHRALQIKSGEAVFAITSGGCNVLGFLLKDPKVIYSVDINPLQACILELKVEGIRALNHDEFLAFAGIRHHTNRLELYQRVKPHLSHFAREYWDSNTQLIKGGFVMNGKYESFIRFAGKFIGVLQGKSRVMGLFETKTHEAQQKYFDDIWNTRRFRLIFSVLFNKYILARRGLVADYFHFDDGSKSFAESFYNRSRKAFRDIPIAGNYFLSLYLLGKYRNESEIPLYLQPQNYEIIKQRLDRIQIVTADAQTWIGGLPENSIDCFALSNICELMSESETHRLFSGVLRTSRDGGRVSFRNLMIPREVPKDLEAQIVKNKLLSKELYNSDRSFVYGKVAAYQIKK